MTKPAIEKKMKIIFMGTPDFAVPALNALHKNNYDVVLVVTQQNHIYGHAGFCRTCINCPSQQ
jgi:methionyl-tRNA formyltransferase